MYSAAIIPSEVFSVQAAIHRFESWRPPTLDSNKPSQRRVFCWSIDNCQVKIPNIEQKIAKKTGFLNLKSQVERVCNRKQTLGQTATRTKLVDLKDRGCGNRLRCSRPIFLRIAQRQQTWVTAFLTSSCVPKICFAEESTVLAHQPMTLETFQI